VLFVVRAATVGRDQMKVAHQEIPRIGVRIANRLPPELTDISSLPLRSTIRPSV